MMTFTDPLFIFQIILFFVSIFLAFYIPGTFLAKRLQLSPFQTIVISCILGIVLWAFQAVIFGYLHARQLTYGYLVITTIFWLRQTKFTKAVSFKKIVKRIDPLLLGITFVGVIVQLITVWFIGYRVQSGIAFCCFWPDSFYHLALVQQLSQTFPPIEPGMQGELVRNYHYLANIVVADMIRVFRLSLLPLQNQLMPLFVSLLLAGSVITVGNLLKTAKSYTRWLLFFIFFSGDIIFLLLFFLGKGLLFNLTVSENATTLWFSPPRVYAMVILFGSLAVLLQWIKKPAKVTSFTLALLIGSLVGFKIYLGFFAFVGFACVTLWYLIKRDIRGLLPLTIAIVIALALYLPVNTNAGGLFYSGLWRIDDFAVRPAFGLINFTLAKQVYQEHGNILRVFLVELGFFCLYIFSLFGLFLLGFIQSRKSLKEFPIVFHIFCLSGGLISFIIGMFFLQSTGGANTLQFLFSIYIVGSVYTALSLSYWMGKLKKLPLLILIALVVLLGGTRVFVETDANIRDLRNHEGYYTISNGELEALSYLKHNISTDAVIAIEYDRANTDECYVQSIFAEKNFYLCGSGILVDHGVNVSKRLQDIETVSKSSDPARIANVLKENEIEYLYVPSDYVFGTNQVMDFFVTVYNNKTMQILRVKKETLGK